MHPKKWVDEEFLKRQLIGRSTVTSSKHVKVPKSVCDNYGIQAGDSLEWFPANADFPERLVPDIMGVLVRRRDADKGPQPTG